MNFVLLESFYLRILPEIARDSLRDVIIHLQGQIISNLKIQWQQDTYVDFSTLQDVSDASQDRAVLILIELQQRIIMSAPIEDLKPPPLFSPDSLSSHDQGAQERIFNPSIKENRGALPAPPAYRPSTAGSQSLITGVGSEKKGHFSLVARIGFGKRAKADQTVKKYLNGSTASSPITPHTMSQLNEMSDTEHLQNRPNTMTNTSHYPLRLTAVNTASSEALAPELESPEFNPWTFPRAPSPSQRSQMSVSSGSQFSHHRIPISTIGVMPSNMSVSNKSISAKDLLPGESNRFAGFCKGAWRLQIGDKKKAMDERQRPGGMYKANAYWQCSKCKFEGRMVMIDKKRKGYDNRVWMTEDEGVQFRWEFLFKSHIESKDSQPNPLHATFGCIFCCGEGRGTPTFGGINSFMTHLQEHRDRLPSGEVLYRMNCLVGRRAQQDEDFDINLISRVVEEI